MVGPAEWTLGNVWPGGWKRRKILTSKGIDDKIKEVNFEDLEGTPGIEQGLSSFDRKCGYPDKSNCKGRQERFAGRADLSF
jgi:hypothetical protein